MSGQRSKRSVMGALAATMVLAVAVAAWAQGPATQRPPLVSCTEVVDVPCSIVATSPRDLAGVWKQYLGNPNLQAPGGVGYIRYRADGTYSLADTVGNTAAPFGMYPRGTISFEGDVMTIHVEGDMVPPECREATHRVEVLRNGSLPVALLYTAIEDACMGRLADLAAPLIWVAP